MNIYKLKNDELKKFANEFNNTPFGLRVLIFSNLPFVFTGLFLTAGIIFTILEEAVGNVFYAYSMFFLANINLLFGCLAQLYYGKLLNDYIEKKK